jgi:TRAP-type mannitol/chloroaromatic compound transport system permease small subunit
MAEVAKPVLAIMHVIDSISEWTGRVFAWLIIPLVGGLSYEVFARYLFDAPTVWAYDTTYMLYGSHFMLGAGYTLLKKGHIRTDIFYNNFSPRLQGTIDATLYLLFFFPGIGYFLWAGAAEAIHSWNLLERSDASPWRPPLYPFKSVIPLAAFLLLIQGISEFLKSLHAARKGEWR